MSILRQLNTTMLNSQYVLREDVLIPSPQWLLSIPAIDATFTASTDTVCSGNSISFTAITGASKYFWDYGDGVSGYSTNNTSHLYTNITTAPVVHTVTLTTTSFYNCTDVKTLDIVVMPVPCHSSLLILRHRYSMLQVIR